MTNLSFLAAVLPLSLLVAGCAADASSAGSGTSLLAGSGQTLVTGSIVREKTATTFNEEVAIASDAHVVITLRTYRGEDVSAPLFVEVDRPFRGFPIDFTIQGDGSAAFANRGELLVGATIFNHAGRDKRVGDMTNEARASLKQQGEHVAFQVSGVESCGAPGAGGFCIGGE